MHDLKWEDVDKSEKFAVALRADDGGRQSLVDARNVIPNCPD
jgi:hypothetical protein